MCYYTIIITFVSKTNESKNILDKFILNYIVKLLQSVAEYALGQNALEPIPRTRETGNYITTYSAIFMQIAELAIIFHRECKRPLYRQQFIDSPRYRQRHACPSHLSGFL